ncbi:MAG: ABC-F family ATP-binding cassette domain-containing protein [Pseudomonadota bacterium]
MASHLLDLKDIRLTFGGTALFEGVNLRVGPGARIALVGRNGSGKSTLLKIAAGRIEADAGVRYADPAARIVYLPQTPEFGDAATVGAFMESGLADTDSPATGRMLMDEFGLSPDALTSQLSGGEARRAAIAKAFSLEPDLLLLDEPTNHLDMEVIEHLEGRLGAARAAIVLISHDRRLLEGLTNETIWVDRGVSRHLNKGFANFEAWRDAVLEEEERDAHKLDRKIAMEEDWVRYGVTARRKRNVRRMADLAALRTERQYRRKPTGGVTFSTNASEQRSSNRVIRAETISKSYGERPIVKDFSTEIVRGDRVALVGPNGAGKTTLLNLLTGALAPDAGRAELGASVAMTRLDQSRTVLDPNARVADALTDGRGDWVEIAGKRKHVAAYLKEFLFAPEQFRSPVSALSGGEQGRLALAAVLAKASNLLVLDEPTNDLDLETLDLLEERLADYPGVLLFVSHDRSFLDRIATSIIAPTPGGTPGQWTEYVGGYSDMLAQRDGARADEGKTTKEAARTKPAKSADAVKSASTTAPARKLSYKEKYALEQLPEKMAAWEADIAANKAALDDPQLFEQNPERFNATAKALAEAETALAAAEEEWLALEMKREALEG